MEVAFADPRRSWLSPLAYTLLHSSTIVVQRVKSASAVVDGQKVSQIGPGMVALVGLHEHDKNAELEY
jgi:hypothetical protein